MEPVLSQGVGYGIVIGLGAFFAVGMGGVTYIQNKYTKFNSNGIDEFTSASRGLPLGLVICGILSSWTWSLTLLQAPTESYTFGFSGSYWYAVGGLLQVSVFSVISSKIKKNANMVTTFPEMAYLRFNSNIAHLSVLYCGLVCNMIVSACILLGGSAVVSALTGMSQYAALFLIPFGVALYVSFGGLRATFISDATHTLVLIIFVIVFVLYVYAVSDKIGSPARMKELLDNLEPVANNYQGSYLTFRSEQGGIFSITSIITGFGLVINDQAYLSRSVASNPRTTSAAYFLGAGAWFVLPFAMGASLGLAARACSQFPDFPTLSIEEVSAGLAAPAAAAYLMGTSGSVMMVLLIFLSVTSSFSGELIASSTLLSYDVYKKYIKPDAKPHEVVRVAKWAVFFWAVFSAALASIFKGAAKISMGWLFNFLGVATAAGVFPIALTFTWKNLNIYGLVGGSIGGSVSALIGWLIFCRYFTGELNVENLSSQWVSFTGNVIALVMGGVLSIGLSLLKPANFDWEATRNSSVLINTKNHHFASKLNETLQDDRHENVYDTSDKSHEKVNSTVEFTSASSKIEDNDSLLGLKEDANTIDHSNLNKQFKRYIVLVLILALVIAIIIPVPLAATPYVFSANFLTAWVSFIVIWLFYTFSIGIILPVVESRSQIAHLFKKVFSGKSGE